MNYTPRILEVEISDMCNAACPMCERTLTSNTKPNNNPDYVSNKTHIRLKDFKVIIDKNPDILHYNFCGNWGDPITAKDLLEIVRYMTLNNKTVSIHTNGSLKSVSWWKELGEVLSTSKDNAVYFSIDGLKDTNHIYRRHTNFDKIIENAKSFINNTMAQSIWMYIPFRHNEHQVDEAKILSKELKFTKFMLNHSSRFLHNNINKFDFYEDNKKYSLEPASNTPMKAVTEDGPIRCTAIENKNIFLSSNKLIWPCCFTEMSFRNRSDRHLNDIIDVSDLEQLDSTKYTIAEIMQSDIFKLIEMGWKHKNPITCYKKCGLFIRNDRVEF